MHFISNFCISKAHGKCEICSVLLFKEISIERSFQNNFCSIILKSPFWHPFHKERFFLTSAYLWVTALIWSTHITVELLVPGPNYKNMLCGQMQRIGLIWNNALVCLCLHFHFCERFQFTGGIWKALAKYSYVPYCFQVRNLILLSCVVSGRSSVLHFHEACALVCIRVWALLVFFLLISDICFRLSELPWL